MSKKLILNTNHIVILQDFEKAVLAGYLFVPGRSDLFIRPTGLMELELFKQELEIPKLGYEDALDVVFVATHDKTDFLLQLQKYILSGWRINLDSIYFDIIGTKSCKLVHPEHPAAILYDKETLDNLDYEELKRIGRIKGCFNRSRAVMTEQILRYQEKKQ